MGSQVPDLCGYSMIPKGISKGICLDACHAFAAGYDIGRGLHRLIREFDQSIGFRG